MPTLTPDAPLADNGQYRLKPWTYIEHAEIVELMKTSYPASNKNLDAYASLNEDAQNIFSFWDSLAIVEMEGLLRYPEAPQVTVWRKEVASSLIRAGEEEQAGPYVENLIEDALNRGQVTVEDLAGWLHEQTPALNYLFQGTSSPNLIGVTSTQLNLPGYTSGYMIQLNAGIQGGICLLALNSDLNYQVVLLYNHLRPIDPFLVRNYVMCSATDITNDGISDLVISQYFGGHIGTTYILVYSLDQYPPTPISFNPGITSGLSSGAGGYDGVVNQHGENMFKLSEWAWNSTCNMVVTSLYRWNEEWLEQADLQITNVGPDCYRNLRDYLFKMEPAKAVEFLDSLITNWGKWVVSEEPFERDLAHLDAGFFHALTSDAESVREVISNLVSAPAETTSAWVAPAQKFLDVYQSSTDLYCACEDVATSAPKGWKDNVCSTELALKYLVRNTPPTMFPSIVDQLKAYGVSVHASGSFDFDGDYLWETWFTVKRPNKLGFEFWIVAEYSDGLKAMLVGMVHDPTPEIIFDGAVDWNINQKAIQLDTQVLFTFYRTHRTREPFVNLLDPDDKETYKENESLDYAEIALFSGSDPAIVKDILTNMQAQPDFEPSDIYLYLMGLTEELLGNEGSAVSAYLTLWRAYPDSPYTIIARSKLELVAP